MSETNGDRDQVWRQAVGTGRPKNSINAISQFEHRGKKDYLHQGGKKDYLNPHLKMDILTTAELWNIMESTFIRQRNITFGRYMLLTTKQSKGESIEHFFGKLKELSENSDLGNQEDTLIRDLFIANKQDPEIQRELLREILEPAQVLRLAINMELGQRNQLQTWSTEPALML